MTDVIDLLDTRAESEPEDTGSPISESGSESSVRVDPVFARSILAGLEADQKRIESKWLYDAKGSKLFDQITDLEDYYPTRTEAGILKKHAADLLAYAPQGSALVELGSGSSTKTRLVLDAVPTLSTYIPIDISADHLTQAARNLSADYEGIDVIPVIGDFTADIALPEVFADVPKLLFFPGSTIGNFEVDQAVALMARLRKLSKVCGFVIGADRVKPESILIRAYDDSEGVTADFNLNLLTRINRELGADFNLDGFRHEARWNKDESRIEMHLVSVRTQLVRILDRHIVFARDETIHTENSHKYDPDRFQRLAARAGWATSESWTDNKGLFGLMVLTPST